MEDINNVESLNKRRNTAQTKGDITETKGDITETKGDITGTNLSQIAPDDTDFSKIGLNKNEMTEIDIGSAEEKSPDPDFSRMMID